MYDRILFPTDGSERAAAVFEYALDVAAAHDATVHVLNVADTSRDSVTRVGGEVMDVLEDRGERLVAETAARATERGVSVVTDVLQGDPSGTVVDYGERYDVDLVVMPTHGREGLKRLLLGSVTERVVNAATAPVLTVTPDATGTAYPCTDVLVPTDGSPGADAALREASALAAAAGATLHLLHVVETASLGVDVRSAVADDRLAERATDLLAEARETAAAASVDDVTTTVAYGRAYREILSYVDEHGIDLLALGTQGETDFSRYVLGGVSAKVLRSSPVPALTVRAAGGD